MQTMGRQRAVVAVAEGVVIGVGWELGLGEAAVGWIGRDRWQRMSWRGGSWLEGEEKMMIG